MKNLSGFPQYLKGFAFLFTRPAYDSFRKIIEAMMRAPAGAQSGMACAGGGTLRQIQYFFNGAKWFARELNRRRLIWMRGRPEWRSLKTDHVILDGSVLEKDKDSAFGGLASPLYSNLRKTVVNGLEIFAAGIRTKDGRRYLLDFMIFRKEKWGSPCQAWMRFARRIARMTPGVLWILDRGFRNQYFLACILGLGRLFLVRVSLSLKLLLPSGKKGGQTGKRGRKTLFPGRIVVPVREKVSDKTAVLCDQGKLWIIPHAVIYAWRQEIKQECAVIVFHRNGFRNPLVLVYGGAEADTEKALALVSAYIGRWSIETLFKETKSWFGLGRFRLASEKAVFRFIQTVIFAHSFMSVLFGIISSVPALKKLVAFVLKKTRNIREPTPISLKLLYESVFLICSSPPKWLTIKMKRTLSLNFL